MYQLQQARKDLQEMLADAKHFESTCSEYQGRDYEELDIMYSQIQCQEDEIKHMEEGPDEIKKAQGYGIYGAAVVVKNNLGPMLMAFANAEPFTTMFPEVGPNSHLFMRKIRKVFDPNNVASPVVVRIVSSLFVLILIILPPI